MTSRGGETSADESLDVGDRPEVLRRDICVVDLGVELLLEERHQLHQGKGVQDALEQRRVVGERGVGIEHDLFLDESADPIGNVHGFLLFYVSFGGMTKRGWAFGSGGAV